MSLFLRIVFGVGMAVGAVGAVRAWPGNAEAALAWLMLLCAAMLAFLAEASLAKRRREVAAAAAAVCAQREAIARVSRHLVQAAALVSGAAQEAKDIEEALA